GRTRELALLERHLAGEGPPVLLLAGEPGIGKTRLLQVVIQQAEGRGWAVLVGGCQRRDGQEPYRRATEHSSRYGVHRACGRSGSRPWKRAYRWRAACRIRTLKPACYTSTVRCTSTRGRWGQHGSDWRRRWPSSGGWAHARMRAERAGPRRAAVRRLRTAAAG